MQILRARGIATPQVGITMYLMTRPKSQKSRHFKTDGAMVPTKLAEDFSAMAEDMGWVRQRALATAMLALIRADITTRQKLALDVLEEYIRPAQAAAATGERETILGKDAQLALEDQRKHSTKKREAS